MSPVTFCHSSTGSLCRAVLSLCNVYFSLSFPKSLTKRQGETLVIKYLFQWPKTQLSWKVVQEFKQTFVASIGVTFCFRPAREFFSMINLFFFRFSCFQLKFFFFLYLLFANVFSHFPLSRNNCVLTGLLQFLWTGRKYPSLKSHFSLGDVNGTDLSSHCTLCLSYPILGISLAKPSN